MIPPGGFDAVRDALLRQVASPDVVDATLYRFLGVPIQNGESIVFHYEDSFGGASIGCSGHAQVIQSDGEWIVDMIRTFCSPAVIGVPVTVYRSEGLDESGTLSLIVFGEIYDAAVVAIRVEHDGGSTNALLSGGAFHAFLPMDATGIILRAYDAEGGQLFEGTPPPGAAA